MSILRPSWEARTAPIPQPAPFGGITYACGECDDGGTTVRRPRRAPNCRNGHGRMREVTQ